MRGNLEHYLVPLEEVIWKEDMLFKDRAETNAGGKNCMNRKFRWQIDHLAMGLMVQQYNKGKNYPLSITTLIKKQTTVFQLSLIF